MSRISSLKFPIIHDIKDNLFVYYVHVTTEINIAHTIFNSIKTAPHHYCKNATIHKTQSVTKRFLIQSKLSITAKTQHSQNSVAAENYYEP